MTMLLSVRYYLLLLRCFSLAVLRLAGSWKLDASFEMMADFDETQDADINDKCDLDTYHHSHIQVSRGNKGNNLAHWKKYQFIKNNVLV